MEYLNQTEKELKIDFNKPLKEQDPLNELNHLANKKRKRTGDLKDHSRSTKKHKSPVQHEEEMIRVKNGMPLTLNFVLYLYLRMVHQLLEFGSERVTLIKEVKILVDSIPSVQGTGNLKRAPERDVEKPSSLNEMVSEARCRSKNLLTGFPGSKRRIPS
ncbi:hypothetical protein Tco_0490679 [Tanacetum coccineum]